MKTKPLVSVLMPAYNAENFIEKAINSILKQDYSNWELFILNDGSSDRTASSISTFIDSRIHTFHHSDNKGYLLACNELLEKATGDFITFLDADDSCSSNRLSTCLNAFERDSELGFLTTNHSRIDEFGKRTSIQSVNVDYTTYSTNPNYNPTLCCATIFLKKELYNKVGGYQPLFKSIGGEDYFWLWELSRNGVGKHLNESLYDYRFHKNQTSRMHEDELHLFVPEVIKMLRFEFINSKWEENKASKIVQFIRQQYLESGFQTNLRKAQLSINQNQRDFFHYALKCFGNVRKPRQIKPLLYLLYSWLIRKGRNVNQ